MGIVDNNNDLLLKMKKKQMKIMTKLIFVFACIKTVSDFFICLHVGVYVVNCRFDVYFGAKEPYFNVKCSLYQTVSSDMFFKKYFKSAGQIFHHYCISETFDR